MTDNEVIITDPEYATGETAEVDMEINLDLVDTRGAEDSDDND